MKYLLSVFILLLCFTRQAFTQSIYIQAGSGYLLSEYDMENYKQASAIPYYGRLGMRFGVFTIGGEYSGSASPFSYNYNELNVSEKRFTEEHNQTYYGGFIGLSTAKNSKVGFTLRVGAGQNMLARKITLANGSDYPTEKIKPAMEARGQAGFSIRLGSGLSLNVEGQYSISERDITTFPADLRNTPGDKVMLASYGGLMGLTYTLHNFSRARR